MTQFVSTSNQANNVPRSNGIIWWIAENLLSKSNETSPHPPSSLFSSFILHFHLKNLAAERERERKSRGWVVESSFPMQFHSPRPFLLLLSLLALVYPGRFVHILHLPSSNASLPFFRFSFPACLSQLPRRLSGCFSATCTPGRCSTGKKDEFITRDTDENIKQTARSYNLFLLNVLNIFLRSSAFSFSNHTFEKDRKGNFRGECLRVTKRNIVLDLLKEEESGRER